MAGTIDQLNFEVILDDKEFTAKVKQDIQLANQLNTSLSSLLNIKKQVGKFNQDDVNNNRKAQQIAVDTARAQEKINREHEKTVALKSKLNAQVEQINRGYQSQSRILNELKGIALGYLSIHGASQLLSSLVRVTGEFELQKTTLAAMLGDLNAAEGIITRIQGLAVESPFQFKELTSYAKQLSAFSVPAQELYDTTKMLADISAGLGVGMDRIVLAYGQVRSAAFLRGQEVRQFTEAGIPILDELAKQFTELEGRAVSAGEVFDKISARLVPFEMVAKVFKDMTSEGGKFYNMQEIQAETLRGKISNLKDAYEVMLNEIGKGQSENLKGAVDWARRLMQNYEETGKVLAELVVTYGVYKAALLTLTIVTNNFTLANSKLYTSLINATKWAINNPYVILAAGITAAGYAIYKNITALEGYEKVHKSFVETEEKYNASLSAEGVKLDALYAKLRLAKEGTEEYEKAKKQIYTQYAGYISDLKEEGVEVGNLATLYDSLKIKVEEYTKAKFRSLAQSDLDQTFEQEVSAVRDRYKTLVSEIESIRKNAGEEPLSAMDKEGLWQYITGDIATLWDMAENPDLKRIKGVLASKILPFGDIAKELQGDLRKIKSTYASDMQAIINLYGETSDELAENDPFKVPLGGDGEGGKSPAQRAIEEQIKSVQKLQDAYEKLMPYLNEVQMKSTLKSLFPNISEGVIDSLDFNAELERLADRLEEFDEDAAQRLRDTIGKDVAGTIAESFEAVLNYKKMLDSWLGEDFELSGSGVSYDISKIIRNLNNEYAKIDQKRLSALEMLAKAEAGDAEALKLVRQKYGEEVWRDYLENGKETIEKLALAERNSAKLTAQEKVNDLASKWVSENTASLDMQDWGDKSISQIARIKEALEDLYDDEVVPDNLKEMAKEAGLSVDVLIAKIRELLQGKIDNTTEEQIKKIADVASDTAEIVSNLASSLEEFAEASGNKSLETIAKGLKDTVDVLDSAAKGFSQGGWIGAIVGGVTSLIGKIAEAAANARRLQSEMAMAAIEYELTTQKIKDNLAIDANDTIFGSNALSAYLANLKIAENSLDNIVSKYRSLKAAENALKWEQDAYANGAEYAIALNPDGTPVSIDQISELTSDLRTGWQRFWGMSKNMFSFDLNELFDEGDNPIQEKFEELKVWYEQYGEGLSDAEKETVERLISEWNRYTSAVEAKAAYLDELFGNLASDLASNMIKSFIETGDAVADLASVFEDLGETILQSLLESWILDDILNKYKDLAGGIADKFAAGEDATADLDSLADNIQSETEVYARVYQALMKEFQDRGLLGAMEDSGTTDLAQGIKGITEDQANLLASYLNAIRADVSYSKTLWVRMDANLQRIADMFISSPTLMEYQAQIAANTYNTATATQEILSELRSVVTTDSGDTAIRVYS